MHLKTGEKTRNNELLLQLCEKLKDSIRSEIEKSKAEGADHDIDQLRHILNELEIMATTENALITFPRIIIDSWDQNDILGTELLKLANLYKNK